MRRLLTLTGIILTTALVFSSCGGSATPVSEGTAPISIEALDGETGVGTDQPLTYGFDSGVDTNTVSVTNFFIQLTSSGECNPDNALYLDTVKITCEDSTCTFDPNPDAETKLSGGTNYTFCITSDIVGVDTTLSFSFTTEGEAPSTLSVSSVTDAASTPNTIETTGSTGIIPTSFTITFSEEPSSTDGILLACGDLSPSVDVSCSGSTCTAEVAEAWRYAMMECTLTIGTETGLSTAATYVFTNGCAVTDDFNADSGSCWTVLDTAGIAEGWTGFDSWAGDNPLSTILTFDTADSELTYSTSGVADNSYGQVYKEISVDSSEVEIIFHVASISGYGATSDKLDLILSENTTYGALGQNIELSLTYNEPPLGRIIAISYSEDGVGAPDSAVRNQCPGEEYYIKINFGSTGTETTTQISTDGINYSDMSVVIEGDFPTADQLTNLSYLTMLFLNSSKNEATSIKEIETTGITATGQY